jgi:regulator of replication initiation timing
MQIRQLTDTVDQQYRHRQELSEEVLHDARTRIANLQTMVGGWMLLVLNVPKLFVYQQAQSTSSMASNEEVTQILASLVSDNETLVQNNNELQGMLSDTREELHSLQEEAEERRAVNGYAYNTGRLSVLIYWADFDHIVQTIFFLPVDRCHDRAVVACHRHA